MAAAKDILLDDDGDLYINPATGDFEIGESDAQHIQDIIESFSGWWKEYPSLGVGIKRYQGSAGKQQELERSIKLQLQGDGYSVDTVRVIQQSDSVFDVYPNAIRK